MIAVVALGVADVKADILDGISELRFGIFDHNIEPGHSEDGVDANIELLFRQSETRYHNIFLDRFLRPNPHIGASINIGNDTSVGYAGLTWSLFRHDFISIEASFGGAVHNGPLSKTGEASYGCRLSFRSSGSIGFSLDPNWRVFLTVDHMSNANLCDKNRGLTNAGVRLGYRPQV